MTVTNERRNELARVRYDAKKEEIAAKRREKRNANLEEERARQRAAYYRNKEAKLAYQKEYAEKNKEKIRQWRANTYQARKSAHNAASRRNALKRRYGLTVEQWEAMFNNQGRVCAICGSAAPGRTRGGFHTDHCHTTGVVRGILCHECNTGLGKFKDSPNLMREAIKYLGAK